MTYLAGLSGTTRERAEARARELERQRMMEPGTLTVSPQEGGYAIIRPGDPTAPAGDPAATPTVLQTIGPVRSPTATPGSDPEDPAPSPNGNGANGAAPIRTAGPGPQMLRWGLLALLGIATSRMLTGGA